MGWSKYFTAGATSIRDPNEDDNDNNNNSNINRHDDDDDLLKVCSGKQTLGMFFFCFENEYYLK